jgi:DNA repair photolyase
MGGSVVQQAGLFDNPPPVCPSELTETSAAFIPLGSVGPARSRLPAGIARLAAEAEEVDARNDVEYRDLPCKTLISPVVSGRVPFDYAINPYRGCEFGCAYCYARYTHEFMELEEWQDFERKIFVKRGARAALLRDLRRLDLRGKSIAIGTATDPYQPAERRYGLTRAVLELLAERRGLDLSITTKGDLVTRDIDLLTRISATNRLHISITVTTPHYKLARLLEPRAPRPDRRLAAVRRLSESGLRAGVFLMPLLPGINDDPADLELLVRLVQEAGAHYLVSQVLFLRSCSRKRFFPFVAEHFPDLLAGYRRLYTAAPSPALVAYGRRKMAEVQELKQRYGLPGFQGEGSRTDPPPDQLTLGW